MTNVQARFTALSPSAQDLFRHIQASPFKLIQLVSGQAIIPNSPHAMPRITAEPLIRELSPTFLEQPGPEQWQIPEPLRDMAF